jgi:hypothetical protein
LYRYTGALAALPGGGGVLVADGAYRRVRHAVVGLYKLNPAVQVLTHSLKAPSFIQPLNL